MPTSAPTFSFMPTQMPTPMPTYSPVPSVTPVCTSRFAFYTHNCALTSSYQTKCFGDGGNGRLGYGDTNIRGDESGEMGSYLPFVDVGGSSILSVHGGGEHTCALLESWDAKCWGGNDFGQLGYGGTTTRGDISGEMGTYLPTIDFGSTTISEIHVGLSHNIILTDSYNIKAWGGMIVVNLAMEMMKLEEMKVGRWETI